MWLDLLNQHLHLILWIFSFGWIYFKLNKLNKQVEEKLLTQETKLNSAIEKLEIGIDEVKNRTRCKMLDREARRN